MKGIKPFIGIFIIIGILFGVSNKVSAEKVLGTSNCYKTWYINVNKQVDPATLTDKNVKVFDEYNNEVKVIVDLVNGGKTISIKPNIGGYLFNKVYYINLSSGIKSIYGENLNLGDYALNSFKTSNDSYVSLGDATVEAAVRRAINKQSGSLMQSDLDKITNLNISNNYGKVSINFADIPMFHNLNKITFINSSFNSTTGIGNLGYYIAYLNNFNSIDLSNNNVGSSIGTILNSLSSTSVACLNLSNTKISDISKIYGLASLKSLNISNNSISNITALNYLKLSELDASGNSITNIFSLSSNVTLTKLNLSGNKIANLFPLKSLTNLQVLNLANNSALYDISSIGDLTNLVQLNLSNDNIGEISALENLDCLTDLDLSMNNISNINSLENMSVLKNLNLAKNYLISDISVLKNLQNISSINLSSNKIQYLNDLSGLSNLTVLDIGNNNIKDISPLEDLSNLEELELNNNKITNIYPLASLNNLSTLYLAGNDIADKTPIQNLTNLVHKDF